MNHSKCRERSAKYLKRRHSIRRVKRKAAPLSLQHNNYISDSVIPYILIMFCHTLQLFLLLPLFLVPVKETAKVIAVKDGDTIEVLLNGKAQRIRLGHIDCPEKNQPYGTKAKTFTSTKSFGQTVTVLHTRQYDRNKRLIAEVILTNGDTLNRELVKSGLAWHYKKYSADTTYSMLERSARLAKKGLWAEKEPVAPWLWRKR